MPIKRRAAKAKPYRITVEAVEAYRAGDSQALHRALGLPLYMPSPLDVSPEHACPWPNGSGGAVSWPLALELRAELIAAPRPQDAATGGRP